MRSCSNPQDFWAHTPNENGEPHYLDDHLAGTAELAESFASAFGAGELGKILGLLHDIGKASDDFQDYLRQLHKTRINDTRRPGKCVDHKSSGALHAAELGLTGELAAFALLGHHGGLPSLADVKSQLHDRTRPSYAQSSLKHRLSIGGRLPSPGAPPMAVRDAVSHDLLIRMLFSCLVDADYLDTEEHFEPIKANARGDYMSIRELCRRFEQDQARMHASVPDTYANKLRREIYAACVRAASGPQGIYKLTVPTGGGKTRSAMAFALRHALKHGLERVIVAIPYTSIIDQNAQVYRQIFGDENVLEHSSAALSLNDDDCSETRLRARLAAENWDASIIATTTVQLFDSLFSNKPGKCRKLHRLARSVLILDEVQTLPVELTQPILDVLKALVTDYGVTLVLCTATQPAFTGQNPYLSGFKTAAEIVEYTDRYFDGLRRVDYHIRREPMSWEHVAEDMMAREQALCVVNSRRDAVGLLKLLDDPGALHLSALMCPAHRMIVLEEIRRRLRDGLPCRVISTQVIECGVDLDAPCVMRAMGPLDRIVQAAGRCNREGLRDTGEVIIFTPADEHVPRGNYETEMADAKLVLSKPGCDLHDPSIFERYFEMVWQDCKTDAYGIRALRSRLDFPAVARKFKMIRDATVPVVVYYGDPGPDSILNDITRKGFASRDDWRALAPYSVSIYSSDLLRRLQQGLINRPLDGFFVWTGRYDSKIGLSEDLSDPADLIARESYASVQKAFRRIKRDE